MGVKRFAAYYMVVLGVVLGVFVWTLVSTAYLFGGGEITLVVDEFGEAQLETWLLATYVVIAPWALYIADQYLLTEVTDAR